MTLVWSSLPCAVPSVPQSSRSPEIKLKFSLPRLMKQKPSSSQSSFHSPETPWWRILDQSTENSAAHKKPRNWTPVILWGITLVGGFILGISFDRAVHDGWKKPASSTPAPTQRLYPLPGPTTGVVTKKTPTPVVVPKTHPAAYQRWAAGRQATALRTCESNGVYTAKGGAYRFQLKTWKSVGGKGDPRRASKSEQDLRAWKLYLERGWKPWSNCKKSLG